MTEHRKLIIDLIGWIILLISFVLVGRIYIKPIVGSFLTTLILVPFVASSVVWSIYFGSRLAINDSSNKNYYSYKK